MLLVRNVECRSPRAQVWRLVADTEHLNRFIGNDALAAAVSMIQKWESFQRGHALAADLELKIGIFSGPCTIVSANGVLDYFGQTVNSAARVQHLAAPRQVVIPAALAEQVPPPEGTVFSERFEAQVKGIDAPLALVRVDVREATPRPDVAPAQG